jgi:hypothetical protein
MPPLFSCHRLQPGFARNLVVHHQVHYCLQDPATLILCSLQPRVAFLETVGDALVVVDLTLAPTRPDAKMEVAQSLANPSINEYAEAPLQWNSEVEVVLRRSRSVERKVNPEAEADQLARRDQNPGVGQLLLAQIRRIVRGH